MLYEVGTADVGLASAGYNARAQDASTVLTNPAGLTRLEGTQLLLGAQLLYGDLKFSIGPGTSPQLGTGDGGNPVGWFPGGGAFFSYSVSPELKLGFALTGNFGLCLRSTTAGWVGRYYVQEATLLGVSFLPSIAYKVNDKLSLGASLNIMYGKLENQVAINNILPAVRRRPAQARRQHLGCGRQPRPALRARPPHPVRAHLQLAGQPRFQGAGASSRGWPRASTRCSAPAGC